VRPSSRRDVRPIRLAVRGTAGCPPRSRSRRSLPAAAASSSRRLERGGADHPGRSISVLLSKTVAGAAASATPARDGEALASPPRPATAAHPPGSCASGDDRSCCRGRSESPAHHGRHLRPEVAGTEHEVPPEPDMMDGEWHATSSRSRSPRPGRGGHRRGRPPRRSTPPRRPPGAARTPSPPAAAQLPGRLGAKLRRQPSPHPRVTARQPVLTSELR
jgi:hypothetical protein